MSRHIMVDLETLGTTSNSVILTIGATEFDPMADGVISAFHVAIDPESCTDFGLKMDAKTVMWWMHPDRDVARKALLHQPTLDLATALEGFSMWLGPDSVPVWGNGATFDNVLLRNAYEATGLECPWKFWHDRCYRTLKNLAVGIDIDHDGILHDALADAVAQTKHMQRIVKHLGLVL